MTSSRTLYGAVASVVAWLLVAGAAGSQGAELDLSGSIAVEARSFTTSPRFAGQLSGTQLSLVVEPEISYESENGHHQFSLIPFARLDGRDDERRHVDLREAYWRYVADDWELLAGVNKVFWGVTESRHLVDILNQDERGRGHRR